MRGFLARKNLTKNRFTTISNRNSVVDSVLNKLGPFIYKTPSLEDRVKTKFGVEKFEAAIYRGQLTMDL
jgi:hypothetical protein